MTARPDADLRLAVQAARAAGAVVMKWFRTEQHVTYKSPDQPLTEADLAADALLKDMPFFPSLIKFIKGDFHGVSDRRVLAMVYKGENAVKGIRAVVGATNPEQAAPGTIRGSFGRLSQGNMENVVHASGNPEEAEREIKIWFKPEEVIG